MYTGDAIHVPREELEAAILLSEKHSKILPVEFKDSGGPSAGIYHIVYNGIVLGILGLMDDGKYKLSKEFMDNYGPIRSDMELDQTMADITILIIRHHAIRYYWSACPSLIPSKSEEDKK